MTAASSWALSRAAQEVTHVQPGMLFVHICLCLPHTTAYTSQAAIKARKHEPKDPLTPPKHSVEASGKSEKSGGGYQRPNLWYSIAGTYLEKDIES